MTQSHLSKMVGGKSAEYCVINLEVDDLKAKE